MRGAHLALAVNNPRTTLVMATVKFFARYKQNNG
jgi:hypothetical protein